MDTDKEKSKEMGEGESAGMTGNSAFNPDGEARNKAGAGGSAPSWRGWVISIVAAVVLSVAATLLLGGTFRLPGRAVAGAGCGDPCCPPGAPPAGR